MKPTHRRAAALVLGLALLMAGCPATVGLSHDDGSVDASPPDASAAPDAPPAVDVVIPRPDVVSPPPDAVPARDAVPSPDDAPADVPVVSEPVATVPARPSRIADAPGIGGPYVFVARRVNFGFESRDLWGRHGFDRDGVFTDPTREGHARGSCRPRGAASPVLDGFEGRDNAFGAHFGGPAAGAGWTETGTNDAIMNGTSAYAFRISDYGGDEDGRVLVEWLPVLHGHRPGDPVSRPVFDGTDVWHVNRHIADQIRVTSAFVTGGQLVMDMSSRAPLRFGSARSYARITVTAGKAVGAITRNADGAVSLGAFEVSAVWPIADALNDFTTLGVCPRDTLTFTFVTGSIQGAADLLGTLENGPMIECDAISMGFGMEFVPATLGDDEEAMPYNEDRCASP